MSNDVLINGPTASIRLEDLLEHGESLGASLPFVENDTRARYGYDFYTINYNHNEPNDGNGVVIVAKPEGGVEPVVIVNDITLIVQALHGRGRLMVAYPETGVLEDHILDSDSKPFAMFVGKGALYCYVNLGEHEFVIRDDSVPGFQDGDERSATPDEEYHLHNAFDR